MVCSLSVCVPRAAAGTVEETGKEGGKEKEDMRSSFGGDANALCAGDDVFLAAGKRLISFFC